MCTAYGADDSLQNAQAKTAARIVALSGKQRSMLCDECILQATPIIDVVTHQQVVGDIYPRISQHRILPVEHTHPTAPAGGDVFAMGISVQQTTRFFELIQCSAANAAMESSACCSVGPAHQSNGTRRSTNSNRMPSTSSSRDGGL